MNIITSLCIDEPDNSFNYQMYYLTNAQKRIVYWKCCITFFATSLRVNPDYNRILYTNDDKEIIIKNIDLKGLLKRWGVKIVLLSSARIEVFRSVSKYHFPTLYKFLVIKEISNLQNGPNFFLDLDCVWIKPFDMKFDAETPILLDIYKKKDIELGTVYKKIDPDYPEAAPILFGGEIIGGASMIFGKISVELENYLAYITANNLGNLKFPNGKSIFDGDEFILSMIYNKHFKDYQQADGFIKRLWTMRKINNATHADFDLTVWHVISEKIKGIPNLFDQVIDEKSCFWTTPIPEFNLYLGSFLNILKRKVKINPILTIQTINQKIIFKLKNAFPGLKFNDFF